MGSLRVWLHEHHIDTLSEDSSGVLTFTYSGSGQTASTRIPLSRSLPHEKETLKGPAVQAFFAGLLPEGSVRRRVAANLGLSEDNDFALLSALGGDCAGALRLLPDGEAPPGAATPIWRGGRDSA